MSDDISLLFLPCDSRMDTKSGKEEQNKWYLYFGCCSHWSCRIVTAIFGQNWYARNTSYQNAAVCDVKAFLSLSPGKAFKRRLPSIQYIIGLNGKYKTLNSRSVKSTSEYIYLYIHV